MATDKLSKLGAYSTASGTYTTAAWATGTNTCTWTAPATGIYIVWVRYELQSADTATRNQYKQLQMTGTATRLLDNVLYYDTTNGTDNSFVSRTISQPVSATQGQTITPYIHTGTAGTVFNVKVTALKIN